jgi:hypothetical protein
MAPLIKNRKECASYVNVNEERIAIEHVAGGFGTNDESRYQQANCQLAWLEDVLA